MLIKAREKFWEYYLFPIVWFNLLFFVLTLIITLTRWIVGKTIHWDSFPFTIILSTVLGVFIGGLLHFVIEYYRPRRIKKLINKTSLKMLNGFGFSKEDSSYSGYYKNYFTSVYANYNMNSGDSIFISIFIDPTKNQIDLLEANSHIFTLNMDEEDGLFWVSKEISYIFNKISRERFKKKYDKMLNFLIKENISPQVFDS